MLKKTTEEFYNAFSDKYTDAIIKCVPRYFEMIEMLFYYLPTDYAPESILELGCGTGNLTAVIYKNFPVAKITAVDISTDILQVCKERINSKNIKFVKGDFSKSEFAKDSFDLVISSIAIHHLKNEEKKKLFNNIFSWLRRNGILVFSDQFKGISDELYEKHIGLWKENALLSNVSESEWDIWMEHQKMHDYHETIDNQMTWLKQAGFKQVDILWKYALWTVLFCKKN
jgi:tRNA (cmo5U34)-methyltransferase